MPRKRVSKLDWKYAARKKSEAVEIRRLLQSNEERSDRLYAMCRRNAYKRAQETEEERTQRLLNDARRGMLKRQKEARLPAAPNTTKCRKIMRYTEQLNEVWLPEPEEPEICDGTQKLPNKFTRSQYPVQLILSRSPSPDVEQEGPTGNSEELASQTDPS